MMHNMETHHDVIVIGGGSAGLMAAGRAAERGLSVCILEKNNTLGKKLKITGGGRCNITNATYDVRTLLPIYGDAEKFLYAPFAQFGVQDTFDFFEKRGLPLVVQARNRAFPHTENAHDVYRVMENYCKKHGVVVHLRSPVEKIIHNTETHTIERVIAGGKEFTAQSYIIATGGASHPETGSTGDAFAWLKDLGHTVHMPTPNIVPLRTKESWVHRLAGRSLSFMKITFSVDGVKKFSETGKILFTHFGLSGPLILNSAKRVADLLHEGVVTARIDCYPDTDHGSLEKNILATFDTHKNKDIKNIIDDIIPHGLGEIIFTFPGMPHPDTKVHSITKEERKALIALLKGLPCTITDLMGMDRAVVSDGGVPLTEIDTRTMRSTHIENLYIIGDMLHINRPSGGYSLQLCWTTGWVAGSAVE